MTVYTWSFNGSVYDHKGFTSLRECCEDANVSYNSASRGKRTWLTDKGVITVVELEVQKIKGRGRKKIS